MTFPRVLMRTGRGERDEKKTSGTLCFYERGELLAVLPVLEGDGMKPLREPADIHPDDDGTRLVVSHTDSRARQDARYRFFFSDHAILGPCSNGR